MSFKKILFFFSFFLFALIVNGQEDILIQSAGEDPLQGNLQENVDQVFELEAIPENKAKKKKKEKKVKEKSKKKGPLLIATNSKQKLVREFEIGEKLAYKSKTNKKILKGELEEIEKEYVKVDGKRVKITSLVMVKKKFVKTMVWRTVGLTRFAIGTGIAAVGAGIAVFSFQQIDPNSTRVIWGALGVVFGTGVGLVGTHLMLKGSKGMFQSSKLKKEKDWKFSAKL